MRTLSLAALLLLLGGCQGAHAEFEVPEGTRGAVAYVQCGGPALELSGLRVRAPGAKHDEQAFVNLAVLSDGGMAASISLTRAFEDVPPGLWSIDAPDGGAPLDVELITSLPAPAEPPPLNVRFVIARGCVDDEPQLRADLDNILNFLPFDLQSKVTRGRSTIETLPLHIDCGLGDVWSVTQGLSRAEREFTLIVTGQPLSNAAGGFAPIGLVTKRADAPLSMGVISAPLERNGWWLRKAILHEMGHMAGLMHSFEQDGSPDALDDTPLCADPSDPNGDGMVDEFECGLDASRNLMFWSALSNMMSASQLDIFLRAPALGP